mmetsp:Transcript_54687/g.62040  ORF Transcript_54687/g.62040 Transcript_54687/m.62040 type:complete len:260 (+) Transcript_54687:192-971(+)
MMAIPTNVPYWIFVVVLVIGFDFFSLAAEGPNFGQGFGEPKFCKPYKCSKGQTPVNKWPLSFKSTGCASLGGGISMTAIAPGSDANQIHESCCDKRIACLQICGNTKMNCDDEFQQCTKDVCSKASDEEKCLKSTSILSMMINFENCQTYDQMQHSHCNCVASEDVPKERQEILRKFYKKFSPDSVDKVEGLAKKADTTRKMANLMGKLVRKYYPETIQKIKDPQQEMMENIMKRDKAKEMVKEENQEDDEEEEDVQEL